MVEEPVKVFKSKKQLDFYLKYWIKKLQIEDWVVCVHIDMCKNQENHGENEIDYVNKCALITIERKEGMDDFIMKQPEELVLVHELLHCKILSLEKDNISREEFCYELGQHQLLESLAKSFIMTKYGLDFDWFKNK